MSVIVTSAHKGRTQIIVLTTYDEADSLTDADGTNDPTPTYPTVLIKKGESGFAPEVVNTEMSKTSLGVYKYYWDTTDVTTGLYNIEIDWIMDGHPQHLEIIRGVTD